MPVVLLVKKKNTRLLCLLNVHIYSRSQPKKKSTASRSPAKQPRSDIKEYKSAQFVKDSDDSSEEEEEKPRTKPQPAAAASGRCVLVCVSISLSVSLNVE